jgi:hypothetical protein
MAPKGISGPPYKIMVEVVVLNCLHGERRRFLRQPSGPRPVAKSARAEKFTTNLFAADQHLQAHFGYTGRLM